MSARVLSTIVLALVVAACGGDPISLADRQAPTTPTNEITETSAAPGIRTYVGETAMRYTLAALREELRRPERLARSADWFGQSVNERHDDIRTLAEAIEGMLAQSQTQSGDSGSGACPLKPNATISDKGTGGLIGFNEIQFWGFTEASERVNTVRAALTAKVSSSPIWHPYEGATTVDDVQTCSRSALATVTLPLASGTNYYFAETAHIIEDPDPNLVEWTSIEGWVEKPRHR
ncbi:MAG: hypothetical protein OXH51_14995 [Gemmatimonadetes bacterium]|nr:hypothetical protein [Gemmatimonadota bacterium]MCY3677842.1 hypothetical protein [Gemmatimonadota bacterium]MYA42931.1 hypothetical protein [Gemmatimonadota bacterium]MYE93840.1 hypothetical protein [Gemmatimonadota bacterium]MYJ12537.1 hypothetical protein [Gemmatimonadota bacterium]